MQVLSVSVYLAVWLLLGIVSPLQSDPQGIVSSPRDVYNPPVHQITRTNSSGLPATENNRYRQSSAAGPFPQNFYYNHLPEVVTKHTTFSKSYSQNYVSEEMKLDETHRVNPSAKFAEQKLHYPDVPQIRDYQGRKNQLAEAKPAGLRQRNLAKENQDGEMVRRMKELDQILSVGHKNTAPSNSTVENKRNLSRIIPEDANRNVRQVPKYKPGFFWTLARLAFESYNDTHSAIKQIGQLVNANLAPETTTRRQVTSGSLMYPTTSTTTAPTTTLTDQSSNSSNETTVSVTTPATTTTTEPYRLTRSQLQSLIRRNLRGLVRLFNIEWNDALNQSDTSIREFQRDLGNQVGIYLKDNPKAY